MKIYCYEQPCENDEYSRVIVTEDEIIADWWDWWVQKMTKKHGSNTELITRENCIEDFVTTHWASEIDV